MTAAFLQSELASLIADSKRKFHDVRAAADKSLVELKAIAVTSETQLAANLFRRPDFAEPFILACRSKHPKLALTGAASIQRLVASRAIARSRLEHVLGACREAVSVSYEVQLKILQTLPALLQLYEDDLHNDLLSHVLGVCATLQASRTALVSNSAGATFDQLVESVFEQAEASVRAQRRKASNDDGSEEDSESKGASIDDACDIFTDFCALLNHSQPSFLDTDSLSATYLLRVLQKILENHGNFIRNNSSLIEACRSQMIPGIMQILTNKDDFIAVAYSVRLAYLLLQKLSSPLADEMGPLLILLLSLADRDAGPPWMRAISLEFFRILLSNFSLVLHIFKANDDGGDNIIASLMAALVRIASEDPTLIGMGRQSTMPMPRSSDTHEDEMGSIEVQGIGGGLASVNSADASATGIGVDFSSLEQPLIEADEPSRQYNVPKTYIYTLILGCISALCEGLSKYIMPLSVTSRPKQTEPGDADNDMEDGITYQIVEPKTKKRDVPEHKYQRLVNPLKISQLPQLAQVETTAKLIDRCWPAILATTSTFLNAALDSYFYHILIRSMQKLAQVSGTLELSTPRDALLTSLAKGSVPANAAAIISISQPTVHAENDESDDPLLQGLKSPASEATRQSVDLRKQSLNIRHLLCLRALLNLGIALGPTLGQEAWFIFIETLQQVEALMNISVRSTSAAAQPSGMSNEAGTSGQSTLASEMTAVNTASKRMFESTRSYTNDSFIAVVTAVFRLLGEPLTNGSDTKTDEPLKSPSHLVSPTRQKRGHQASRSISGLWVKSKALDAEVSFVLTKVKDLSRINLHRFISSSGTSCSWDLLVLRLLQISEDYNFSTSARIEAAEILDLIAMETVKLVDRHGAGSSDDINMVQSKSLASLQSQMSSPAMGGEISRQDLLLQEEIRTHAFEAMEDIIGHCGESLRSWDTIFTILETAVTPDAAYQESAPKEEFVPTSKSPLVSANGSLQGPTRFDTPAITAAAFRCIQLICTDFLQVLDQNGLQSLISLMHFFGTQQDMNMALTVASLLRNITTLLQERVESLDVSLPTEKAADIIEQIANPAQLWFAALKQLTNLCRDARGDVRNASVRIFVQLLVASGEQLMQSSWGIVLRAAPISLLHDYLKALQNSKNERASLEATSAYLTEGTTKLIREHITSVTADPSFGDVWRGMVEIFEAEMRLYSPNMYALAFDGLSALLEALSGVDIDRQEFVKDSLRLWASHPLPVSDGEPDEPNQAAIAAHAAMFDVAYQTSSTTVQGFEHQGKATEELLQISLKQSILSALHPPYTNDVKNVTIEQEKAVACIAILHDLLDKKANDYANFLMTLLESMRWVDGEETDKIQKAPSKRVQVPTFIALSSSCLDLLRDALGGLEFGTFDACRALQLLTIIVNTKYTPVPANLSGPLWRNATTTATHFLSLITPSTFAQSQQPPSIASQIVSTISAVLGAGGLDVTPSQPTPSTLETDQTFDIASFRNLHTSSLPLLSHSSIPSITRKDYILTIFHASLFAKPWFNDLPSPASLISRPLENITSLRHGSVHVPIYAKRRKLAYAALDALFELLDPKSSGYEKVIAREAAPYLLLRAVHPMKVFLADQPLRGLNPLPPAMQEELGVVLEKCLVLRCDNDAIAHALVSAMASGGAEVVGGSNTGLGTRWARDGKSHLRALFKMVLRLQKGWKGVMRLPDGAGWQDGEAGRVIEGALERWSEVVGEEWGFP